MPAAAWAMEIHSKVGQIHWNPTISHLPKIFHHPKIYKHGEFWHRCPCRPSTENLKMLALKFLNEMIARVGRWETGNYTSLWHNPGMLNILSPGQTNMANMIDPELYNTHANIIIAQAWHKETYQISSRSKTCFSSEILCFSCFWWCSFMFFLDTPSS